MINWKKALPHLGALLIFVIITMVYFKPYIFDNRPLKQSDIKSHQGMAQEIVEHREKYKEEPLWTNSMFGGMPAYQISTYYKGNLVAHVNDFFRVIIPHPVTFILLCMVGFYLLLTTLKMPPLMAGLGALAFTFSSFFFIIIPAGHNSQGMAIAYMGPVVAGLLLTFRGRLWLGTAITALSVALEIDAGHIQVTYYLIFISLFIGLGEVIRLVKEKKFNYLYKAAGALAIGAVLAVLPSVSSLYLTNEYGKDSTRGGSELTIKPGNTQKSEEEKAQSGLDYKYAMAWSYGVGETMTLLIPDYSGGASMPLQYYDETVMEEVNPQYSDWVGGLMDAYFGEQPFTSGPVYVGAIICFLFVLGIFIVKDPLKWWLLGLTALSIMLSWGDNFDALSRFFFDHVPLYDKFRVPTMALVIAEFTMPLLALLALRELVVNRQEVKEKMGAFYASAALVGGICLLVWMMPDTFVSPTGPTQDARAVADINREITRQKRDELVQQGMPQQMAALKVQEMAPELEQQAKDFYKTLQPDVINARLKLVTDDAMRSFLFVLGAVVLCFTFIRFGYNMNILLGGLTLLVLIDQVQVARRFVSDERGSYEEKARRKKEKAPGPEMGPGDAEILKDPDPNYRVLNVTGDIMNEAQTAYYHKSLGGYHPAKLRRFQELYDFYIASEARQALDAMNRYYQSDSLMQDAFGKLRVLNMFNTRYFIYGNGQGFVPNRRALGNAWFVSEYVIVPDADAEITMLGKTDPAKAAIVDKRYEKELAGFVPKPDPAASIKLTSYKANELTYEAKTGSEQLALFSEVFYDKGWNAYLDGKLVPHFRANYILRAMRVPAGQHTIVFKFEPSFYKTGGTIGLIGSLLIIGLLGWSIWKAIKEGKGEETQAEKKKT